MATRNNEDKTKAVSKSLEAIKQISEDLLSITNSLVKRKASVFQIRRIVSLRVNEIGKNINELFLFIDEYENKSKISNILTEVVYNLNNVLNALPSWDELIEVNLSVISLINFILNQMISFSSFAEQENIKNLSFVISQLLVFSPQIPEMNVNPYGDSNAIKRFNAYCRGLIHSADLYYIALINIPLIHKKDLVKWFNDCSNLYRRYWDVVKDLNLEMHFRSTPQLSPDEALEWLTGTIPPLVNMIEFLTIVGAVSFTDSETLDSVKSLIDKPDVKMIIDWINKVKVLITKWLSQLEDMRKRKIIFSLNDRFENNFDYKLTVLITIYLRFLGSYFTGLTDLFNGVPSIARTVYLERVKEEADLFLKGLEEFAGGVERLVNSPFIPNYLAVMLKKIVFKYLISKETDEAYELLGLSDDLEKMKLVLSLTDIGRHTEIRVFYFVISASIMIDLKDVDGLKKLYEEMLEYKEKIVYNCQSKLALSVLTLLIGLLVEKTTLDNVMSEFQKIREECIINSGFRHIIPLFDKFVSGIESAMLYNEDTWEKDVFKVERNMFDWPSLVIPDFSKITSIPVKYYPFNLYSLRVSKEQ